MNFWGVRLTLLECKLESEKVNKNIGTNKAGSDVKKVQYMKLYLASQCIYVDNSLSVIIVILLSKTSGRMKSRITLTSFLCKVGIFHLPNTFRNFDGKAH